MRVFLVESESIFPEGLKSVIGRERNFVVLGEAATCQQTLETVKNVDLVILKRRIGLDSAP